MLAIRTLHCEVVVCCCCCMITMCKPSITVSNTIRSSEMAHLQFILAKSADNFSELLSYLHIFWYCL